MNNRERLPELLSPAGDMDCLKAAVGAGCDAVYLGGSQFNARQGAGNFSTGEMEAAVRYCTLRGVRTYLTLNTLIKEREWERLEAFAAEIAGMGFSGVILQDIGVAAYDVRSPAACHTDMWTPGGMESKSLPTA